MASPFRAGLMYKGIVGNIFPLFPFRAFPDMLTCHLQGLSPFPKSYLKMGTMQMQQQMPL